MASKISEAKGCYNASPAGGYAVTKSDTNLQLPFPRALYVGAGGDLTVTLLDGTDVTIPGVPTGTFLWIQVQKVKATLTTASLIVAFYDN